MKLMRWLKVLFKNLSYIKPISSFAGLMKQYVLIDGMEVDMVSSMSSGDPEFEKSALYKSLYI